MGYEKTIWQDHILDAQTGEVVQEGTKVTAERLNNMETGIEDATANANPVSVTINQGQQVITVDRKAPYNVLNFVGRTLVNLLGRDGNCVDNTKFTYANISSSAVDTTKYTYGSESIRTTPNGSGDNGISKDMPVSNTKYYLFMADIFTTAGYYSRVRFYDVGQWTTMAKTDKTVISTGSWQTVYHKISASEIGSRTTLKFAVLTSDKTNVSYYDGLRIYEVSAADYAKIDVDPEYTGAKLAAKFPYVDSAQGVNAPYIIKYGENLLPPFTEWLLPTAIANSITTILSPYNITVDDRTVTPGLEASAFSPVIPVVGGQAYTFTNPSSSGYVRIAVALNDGTTVRYVFNPNTTRTIILPPNAYQVTVVVGNLTGYTDENNNATYTWGQTINTFTNPVMTPGPTAKPFTPREDSYMFLHNDGKPWHSNLDGSVADQLVFVNGEHRKLAAYRDVSFDADDEYFYNSDYAGYKRVAFKNLDENKVIQVLGSATLVKHDGKILKQVLDTGDNAADQFFISGDSNRNVYITVPDTDSGWGDGYTPTADEVKAYFMGWKMKTAGQQAGSGSYTGSGTKAWVEILKAKIEPTSTNEQQDINIVLTNAGNYPGILYTPYRLIYQLAKPVPEPIAKEGNVTFHDGANQVDMGCGVIVREKTDPAAYNNYHWINGVLGGAGKLKYRTKSIFAVYRGKVRDPAWSIGYVSSTDQATYGLQQVNAQSLEYDRSTVYEATYLALDTYLLGTAPLQITGIYASNVKEALDAVLQEQARIRKDVDVVLITGANKKASAYLKITPINGWAYVGSWDELIYNVDDQGDVFIWGSLTGGDITDGTIIGYVPIELAPTKDLFVPIMNFAWGTPKTVYPAYVAITSYGAMKITGVKNNGWLALAIRYPAKNRS